MRSKPILLFLPLLMPLLFWPPDSTGSFFSGEKPQSSVTATEFLPVEDAFRLEGRLTGTKLMLTWEIEPGHYLYRSRFGIRLLEPAPDAEHAPIVAEHIPSGQKVQDEFQGEVNILRQQAQLHYRVKLPPKKLQQGIVIEVHYQGCAEAGLCYPPHTEILNLVNHR